MTDFQFLEIPSCGLAPEKGQFLSVEAEETITEIERYTGLPTLEYDDRIEALEYQAILLEKQILQDVRLLRRRSNTRRNYFDPHTRERSMRSEAKDCPLHLEATE